MPFFELKCLNSCTSALCSEIDGNIVRSNKIVAYFWNTIKTLLCRMRSVYRTPQLATQKHCTEIWHLQSVPLCCLFILRTKCVFIGAQNFCGPKRVMWCLFICIALLCILLLLAFVCEDLSWVVCHFTSGTTKKKFFSFVTSNAFEDVVACDLLMQNAKSLRLHSAHGYKKNRKKKLREMVDSREFQTLVNFVDLIQYANKIVFRLLSTIWFCYQYVSWLRTGNASVDASIKIILYDWNEVEHMVGSDLLHVWQYAKAIVRQCILGCEQVQTGTARVIISWNMHQTMTIEKPSCTFAIFTTSSGP